MVNIIDGNPPTQIIAMTDSLQAAAFNSGGRNPFFDEWTAPFGVPPFTRILPEHFMPAFNRAFAEHNAEIGAIASDPAAPDFENTIAAMELSGRPLGRVSDVFGVLTGSDSNDALLAIE